MNNRAIFLIMISVVGALCLVASPARVLVAAEISIPLSEAAVISDSTEHRIMVKFAIPDSLSTYRILLAVCEVELSALNCGGTVPSFEAAPVATAWNSNSVAWDAGWSNNGGNFERAGSADVTLLGEQNPVASFAVTEWLQAASKGRKVNYGFILYPTDGSEYDCEALALAENIAGSVRVVFTK